MKYWFRDNWYGSIETFNSLRDAKKAAKEQTGISVAIKNEKGKVICFSPASGHTPA